MQKPMIDREILAKWLGDIISEEMKKSDSEIDWDLVDECEAYLAELYSDVVISEKELKANIAKIKEKTCNVTSSPKRSRKPRMRRLLAAGLAAAVLLCCAVTAYAFVPSVRDMINTVLRLPVGSMIDDQGITFTYEGRITSYNSIDELMQNEKLDIMYPHSLPDGLKIKHVTCTGENTTFRCTITFADNLGSVVAEAHEIDASKISSSAIIHESLNDIKYYITDDGTLYTAIAIHSGWTYRINMYSMEHLIGLLDNIY